MQSKLRNCFLKLEGARYNTVAAYLLVGLKYIEGILIY